MSIIQKAREYPKGEKNKLLIIFVAIIAAIYFGLFFPQSRSDLSREENLVNRRLNRIKIRTENIPEPAVSGAQLERQLADIRLRMRVAQERLDGHEGRFAAVDSTEELKALRLEISELAQSSGLDLKNMGELSSPKPRPQAASKTGESSDAQTAKPAYSARPQMRVGGTGSFASVLAFLDGLNDLSRHAVVLRMQLKARPIPAQKEGVRPGPRALNVEFILAL